MELKTLTSQLLTNKNDDTKTSWIIAHINPSVE